MGRTSISFIVHTGCTTGGSPRKSGGERNCSSIYLLDRDSLKFIDLEESLLIHGYQKGDGVYYLKPSYVPPQGLVLILNDEQIKMMLDDHKTETECSLYIFARPQELVTDNGSTSRFVSPSSIPLIGHHNSVPGDFDKDDLTLHEEYVQQQLREKKKGKEPAIGKEPVMFFQGDSDTEDLYGTSQIDAEVNQAEPHPGKTTQEKELVGKKTNKRKVKDIGQSAEVDYLSDEPNDDTIDFNDEAPIYVHRSRGIEDIIFDESTLRRPHMQVGMLFSNVDLFRAALKNMIINEGREVFKGKNDRNQVSVKCKADNCPWYIYASKLPGEDTFKIKKYVSKHSCGKSHNIAQLEWRWLTNEYMEFFRSDKKWDAHAFQDCVRRDTNVEVSISKAYRARREAYKKVMGDHDLQFKRIQDYAHAVLSANPGSKVFVKCEVSPEPEIRPRFQRLFLSFDAQITGFLGGCRPFIGIDGCHIKLNNGSQILAAQGRDANNNLFPIAFAVVESECTESWTWFLLCLEKAIGKGEEFGGWVFMSDRQKVMAIIYVYFALIHVNCFFNILLPYIGTTQGSG